MDEAYKEHQIGEITDNTILFAVRTICSNALWIDDHISVGDDGEWDYKLKKVLNLFKEDIKELAEIQIESSDHDTYSGPLTLEKLVNEFSDFYWLVSCTSPLGEQEAGFVIAYDFLSKWLEQRRPSRPGQDKRDYFWEEIHKDIKQVSYDRYRSGHYADSVEASFKEVIKRVKDYVNVKTEGHFEGDRAMNRAFGFENQEPLIKFNELSSDEERDEQRGILNLYKGVVGIRNRKAHENIVLNDKLRALEYLALASLLLRLFEEFKPAEPEAVS